MSTVTPLRALNRNAERQRRYRARRRAAVAPPATGVTLTTIDMAALAGRLESGRATVADMASAGRLVLALIHRLPRDGSITIETPNN